MNFPSLIDGTQNIVRKFNDKIQNFNDLKNDKKNPDKKATKKILAAENKKNKKLSMI